MILAHEVNEFTMTEAMKYYPKLKEVFKVSHHTVLAVPTHHSSTVSSTLFPSRQA